MAVTGTPITSTLTGTLGTLVSDLRTITRDIDNGVPTELLWSDSEIMSFLNEGETEIAERTLCIEDTDTMAVCDLTLVTSTATYSTHASVIDVKNITFSHDTSVVLTKADHQKTEGWLDKNVSGWRTMTAGDPMYYILRPNSKITFVPAVDSGYNATTATLTVVKRPTTILSSTNTTPEVSSKYYEAMKKWALYRMYDKKDSQTLDPKTSLLNYTLFENMVGPRPSLNVERIVREEPEGMQMEVNFG